MVLRKLKEHFVTKIDQKDVGSFNQVLVEKNVRCIWMSERVGVFVFVTYHGVQKLDASLQLRSGLAVEAEQKSTDGLLVAQAEIIPF